MCVCVCVDRDARGVLQTIPFVCRRLLCSQEEAFKWQRRGQRRRRRQRQRQKQRHHAAPVAADSAPQEQPGNHLVPCWTMTFTPFKRAKTQTTTTTTLHTQVLAQTCRHTHTYRGISGRVQQVQAGQVAAKINCDGDCDCARETMRHRQKADYG